MKNIFLFTIPLIASLGCGSGGDGAGQQVGIAASGGLKAMMAAPLGGSEHTDADQVPDIALDRAFQYGVRMRDEKNEVVHLLSTLIPHAKGFTYGLANEKAVNDSVWQMTFIAEADENVDRGLFLHAAHQVPVVYDGKAITEVEVVVLDVNGNATGEVGGVPGQPKTKKPIRVRWADCSDIDPAMPPLEDITIFANSGKVDDEHYIVGYAFMKEASKDLSLKDQLAKQQVEFTANPDSSGHRFLFFDHAVTAFNGALITAFFPDGDGDPLNLPRETRERP